MILRIFPILGILMLPSFLFAGPFGFDGASVPSDIASCKKLETPFLYDCSNPEKPHPKVEAYVLKYVEGVGTCSIRAVGKDVSDNVFGSSTRSEFQEISDQLELKYGQPTDEYNYLTPGSIWDEPEDWMMALRKQERVLVTTWKPVEQIDGIDEVYLAARASDTSTGYFVIEFITPLDGACEEKEAAQGASSF